MLCSSFGCPRQAKDSESPLAGKISITFGNLKNSYVSGEFIFIDDTIKNLTSEALKVPKPTSDAALSVFVRDGRGDPVYGGFIADYLGGPPMVQLGPKEELVNQFDLELYGNSSEKTGTVKNLLPGRYKVWVELSGVKSEEATLQVVQRNPGEEFIHHELNRLARVQDRAYRISSYYDLLQRYQDSTLTPNIYHSLLGTLSFFDPLGSADEQSRIARDYIDRFPDFGGSRIAITHLRIAEERVLGVGKEERPSEVQRAHIQRVLGEIAEKYRGLRVERFANEQIQSARLEWDSR